MTRLLEFVERHRARHLFRSSHLKSHVNQKAILKGDNNKKVAPS